MLQQQSFLPFAENNFGPFKHIAFVVVLFESPSKALFSMGRTGRKKLGGRKEICPTFSDCARVVKKYFPEKLSKIVVDGGGEE
jgi:hypothetical protein